MRRRAAKWANHRSSLIIVDVQPEYERNISFDVAELLRSAQETYNKILVLWNGPDLGFCSQNELIAYYAEKLDYEADEFLAKATFFDKSYGFFRDLMDHPCFDHYAIVKIVSYMIQRGINDIRELSEQDVQNIGVSDLLHEQLEDYGFFIPDLQSILEDWNGSDICGGGQNECLAEVEILAEAMNLRFNQVQAFIYA